MNPQKNIQSSIQHDVRNVLFFVFFALTIGAGSGLLHSARSADTMLAQETQAASPLLPLVSTSTVEDIQEYLANTQTTIPGVRVTPQQMGEGDQKMLVVYLDEDQERKLIYLPETNQYHVVSPAGSYMFLNADSPIVMNAKEAISGGVAYDPLRVEVEPIALPDGTIPGVDVEGKIVAGRVVVLVSEDETGLTELEYDPTTSEYYIYLPDGTAPIGPLRADDKRIVALKEKLNNNPQSEAVPQNKQDSRCSTTYVNTKGQQKSCYGAPSDKGHILVEALAKCLANTERTPDAKAKVYAQVSPYLAKGMCGGGKAITEKPKTAYIAVLSAYPLYVYPVDISGIPQGALNKCRKEFSDVIGVMGGINGNAAYGKTATTATAQDAEVCAWKGPAVCYPDTAGSGEFTCKSKAEIAVGGEVDRTPIPTYRAPDTTRTPPPTTGCNGLGCFLQNFVKDKKFQQTIKELAGKLLTGNKNGCPSGYQPTGQSSDGKTQCSRIPEKPQAQCVMAANKTAIAAGDEVVLRWKTANAEVVNIDGIGADVSANGERVLHPAVTTTYTLTAKGDGNEKTCTTTIVVNGEVTGPTGAYPPTLTCSPNAITEGESVRVAWACQSPAEVSVGEGIDTQGRLSGEVTVLPKSNTQYRVACLQGEEEVGANICAVSMGNPQYDIVTYPTRATKGERVRISWGSLFTNRCRVQGPRGFDYSHTEGVVVTEPFAANHSGTPADATYTLECLTDYGTTVTKEAVVEYRE